MIRQNFLKKKGTVTPIGIHAPVVPEVSKNPVIKIPLSVPFIGAEEELAVLKCVQSGWISSISPAVKKFEQHFAERLGISSATATNAGTAALHLALLALGIGPTDEVIVPALTFIATVNPVRYVGATPVFVDAEPKTLGMDPTLIESAITKRTKAIVVTHLYGLPAQITEILKIAKRYNIPVIEDAAEALGATVNGKAVGTFGTIGCFSFNGNKTLTCGGGGMVVTDQPEIAKRILHLSTQAREPGLEFSHDEIGYNYRMTGMQAAMGLAQLEKLEFMLDQKRKIAKIYADELRKIQTLTTYEQRDSQQAPSYWLSVILTQNQETRERVIQNALMHGIEMRPFFKPISSLKPYQPWVKGTYPIANLLWERGICLPSSPALTEEAQAQVISLLWECLDKRKGNLTGFPVRV